VWRSHSDHLIVDEVGSHAHEREIAPLLTDHLMAGREGDEMRKPLKREYVAVAHISAMACRSDTICDIDARRVRSTACVSIDTRPFHSHGARISQRSFRGELPSLIIHARRCISVNAQSCGASQARGAWVPSSGMVRSRPNERADFAEK